MRAPWNDDELYHSINGIDAKTQEEYKKVWAQFKPNDFYFVVRDDYEDGYTTIWIVPCDYFDAEGEIWDQSMGIAHLLPPDVSESMESVWDSELDLDSVKAFMKAAGFQKSKKFKKYVNENFF